jgi:hypothetical protein
MYSLFLQIYFIKTSKKLFMKNWKTTLGGILAAVGSYLVNSQTGVINVIGQIAQVIGIFLIGAAAQDAPTTAKPE